MSYQDLNVVHNPATGTAPPATWGDQVRDNDEYLHLRGPYICTSGTRPGSPFEGQQIYETDTQNLLCYDGSAWRLPGNLPWGAVGYVAKTANQSTITSIVDISTLTLTWTVVAGRVYRVTFTGHLEVSNLDTVARFDLTYSDNTVFQIAQTGLTQVNVAETVTCTTYLDALSAGSTTIKVRAERVTGTGNVQCTASATLPAVFMIEDIGLG